MPRGVPKSGKRKTKKRTALAVGRTIAYGSSRYTTQANKKGKRNLNRAKRVGTALVTRRATNSVTAAAGAKIGMAMGTNKPNASAKRKAAGAVVGGAVGYGIGRTASNANNKLATKRGWSKENKQRMSTRTVKKVAAKRKKRGR